MAGNGAIFAIFCLATFRMSHIHGKTIPTRISHGIEAGGSSAMRPQDEKGGGRTGFPEFKSLRASVRRIDSETLSLSDRAIS